MSQEAKIAAIKRLEDARSELERALNGCTPEAITTATLEPGGAWTIRDMLCHLSGLDEVAAGDAARARSGAIPLLSSWAPEKSDAWNEFFVGTRVNFPPQQVLNEFFSQRFRLLSELAAAPEAQFAEGGFLRTMVDLMANHERHHAEQLAAVTAG